MSDINETLRKAKEALDRAAEEKRLRNTLASEEVRKMEDDRKNFISSISSDLVDVLAPLMESVAENSKLTKEDIKEAISQIKVEAPIIPQIKIPDVKVTLPEIKIPDFPEQKAPVVKVPKPEVTVNFDASRIRIPDVIFPEEMNTRGWLGLMGYDKSFLSNPLPVQIRDYKGNPISLFENLTQIVSGGGKHDHFTVKGFGASAYADYLNADNRLRVSMETGGGGLTDSELRASAVEVSQVSGALWSTIVGGVVRTTNPSAIADGSNVRGSFDDLGRILVRPIQVRDLIQTAYATLTNGTETTLRAAIAGVYLDLIYIVGSNNSSAAVTVNIRPVTAGNIVMSLQIPANGTAGISCPIPLPQSDTGNNWTADMDDITGTTVYLSALFSQEI